MLYCFFYKFITWKTSRFVYKLFNLKQIKKIMDNIRNFCIIAHIDHGKSTLADRMLELSGVIQKTEDSQILDKMDLEQERWITIKLTPSRMYWKWYEFNLIDTPWHVDFQYEVSRSLSSVEWAILLVDATQWIQAQTLSTLYMAIEYGLEVIPVLNKIDLPAAEPQRVADEIESLAGIRKDKIINVSAKTWENVDLLMDRIIDDVPEWNFFREVNKYDFFQTGLPENLMDSQGYSRALIFDSVYDKYKWVLAYVKVLEWSISKKSKINLLHSWVQVQPGEVGYFYPNYVKDYNLSCGQIGYIVTAQKSVRDVKIWDTMLVLENDYKNEFLQYGLDHKDYESLKPLAIPGFKKMKPFVYSWVYPMDAWEYDKLRDAFEKLSINDSAIEFEYENSKALGYGFRAGFLGTLHMDIIKQRLLREYWIETIFTIPNVIYFAKLKNLNLEKVKSWINVTELVKSWMYRYIIWEVDPYLTEDEIVEEYKDRLKPYLMVRAWGDMPEPGDIESIWEPTAEVEIVGPNEYSGNVMELAWEYRWELKNMEYIDNVRVLRRYKMPMGELIVDFYDKLKSATKWFSTMNYEFKAYENNNLTKLDILVNNEKIEAFTMIVHKDKAYFLGRDVVEKLKELIPKHLFSIPLQASLGSKVIARETIPALKKDVLAKCYWWDVTRKRKLLAKQKEGKKKMKEMWKVSVPNDIFIKMVSRD